MPRLTPARRAGRGIQQRLYDGWGGAPTTRGLRHQCPENTAAQVARRHALVARVLPDVELPSADDDSRPRVILAPGTTRYIEVPVENPDSDTPSSRFVFLIAARLQNPSERLVTLVDSELAYRCVRPVRRWLGGLLPVSLPGPLQQKVGKNVRLMPVFLSRFLDLEAHDVDTTAGTAVEPGRAAFGHVLFTNGEHRSSKLTTASRLMVQMSHGSGHRWWGGHRQHLGVHRFPLRADQRDGRRASGRGSNHSQSHLAGRIATSSASSNVLSAKNTGWPIEILCSIRLLCRRGRTLSVIFSAMGMDSCGKMPHTTTGGG